MSSARVSDAQAIKKWHVHRGAAELGRCAWAGIDRSCADGNSSLARTSHCLAALSRVRRVSKVEYSAAQYPIRQVLCTGTVSSSSSSMNSKYFAVCVCVVLDVTRLIRSDEIEATKVENARVHFLGNHNLLFFNNIREEMWHEVNCVFVTITPL